jgi:hypothetical protein
MSLAIILEVMIGLSFVYLLFSLVLTALTEFLSSLLRRRPGLLRMGIRQMLQDDGWTDRFYEHPLIKALRQPGPFWFNRNKLRHPSYIPRNAFAETIIDMLSRNRDGEGRETRDTTTIETTLASNGLPRDLAVALSALYDTSGRNPAGFQMALEKWFDDAMERVSGWYKRRTNSIVLALAVLLVILANVDSMILVKALWSSPTMREGLMAEAEAFAKQHAEEVQSQVNAPDSGGDDAGPPPETPDVQPEIEEKAAKLYAAFGTVDDIQDKLALPLGWAAFESNPKRRAQMERYHGLGAALWRHWLGWSISVFALSLGAPFWFDTLNRLIKVRAAGRKPEEVEAEKQEAEGKASKVK